MEDGDGEPLQSGQSPYPLALQSNLNNTAMGWVLSATTPISPYRRVCLELVYKTNTDSLNMNIFNA